MHHYLLTPPLLQKPNPILFKRLVHSVEHLFVSICLYERYFNCYCISNSSSMNFMAQTCTYIYIFDSFDTLFVLRFYVFPPKIAN